MLHKPVNTRTRASFPCLPAVTGAGLHCALAVTLVLMAIGLSPAVAQADRVVIVTATGAGDEDQHAAVTDAVSGAVRALGHDAVSEAGAIDATHHEVPEGANDFRAVAELNRAAWVVVPVLHDITTTSYWLTLRVGYARETRVEEIDAEVLRPHERERLMALLQALLRPDGLGADAARLAGADTTGRDAAQRAQEEAERLAREAEERAAREQLDAAARAEAERAEAERAAFAERERYGANHPMLLEGGLGVHPLLRAGSSGAGGTLGTVELVFGYALGDTGLELRAGLDLFFGAAGGFALHGGAAYLTSPFRMPLHLGAGVDVGVFVGLTGNRVPSLYIRAGGLVVYHATKALFLEAQLPEITVLSANGGAVALGLSVRAGTRF